MIAIPVYVTNKPTFELLQACINSWKEIEDDIWLYVNKWEYDFDVTKFDKDEDISVFIRQNNSVAGAWNDAITHAYNRKLGEVILSNQDIQYHDEQQLSPFYTDNFIAARTKEGMPDFSLFAVSPSWILETFGTLRPFDENFEGAYLEDNDFMRQCEVKGIKLESTPIDFEHYGSSVVKHCAEMVDGSGLHKNFRKNHVYYINKWGGVRGYERFKTPFNR